jgi:hypothetical protein
MIYSRMGMFQRDTEIYKTAMLFERITSLTN